MRRGYPPIRLALVPALGVLGAVVGWSADADPVAATVLLLEPLLWVLVLWLAYAAVLRGQGILAFSVLCGGITAAASARIPVPPPEPQGVDAAPFAERTRTCARDLELPASPFRILHWTIDHASPALLARVAELRPDVVVLRGALSSTEFDHIKASIGGEALTLPGERDTHVFTRGAFDLCGKADHWTDSPADGVSLGLVFLAVDEATRFPLVTAQLPAVWSVPDWARAGRAGRSALRTTADALASSLLVVAVEAPYALSSPRLSSTLYAAQLWPVATVLDWPARPFGLHAFAPLWAGEAWTAGAARAVHAEGTGRSGTLVEVRPRWLVPSAAAPSAP